MKFRSKKLLSLILALGMVTSSLAPATTAKAEGTALVGEIQKDRYVSGETKNDKAYPDDEDTPMVRNTSEFMKISHPELPPNRRDFDPTTEDDPETKEVDEHAVAVEKHKGEVAPDGLIDYLGDGKLSEPKEGGVGDRGQSYSWTGISHGDWMYVSTQFNSAGSTGDIMGKPVDRDEAEKQFGGDYFAGEDDDGNPGSTLSKINVKTGETVILMSASKNGLDAQFRASIEYKGKLYFCGSVNHVPSIYEVDPNNDALKCVYRDPSMINYPGNPEKGYPAGVKGAWMEAKGDKNICPAIRGITTFKTPDGEEYLVISCVGVDENPYIAVSNNPSSGKFDIVAHAWEEVPTYSKDGFTQTGGVKGELFGYPACHLRDSIFGGSIWEMVQFDGKLYVAMCTGTPASSESHKGTVEDKDGNKVEKTFIDTMQSFAIVCGEYNPEKKITDKEAWTWTPVVGDKRSIEEGGDAAKYTFGIDPERTRAGACNMVIFKDHLYIGEYNDTQIAFMNMNDEDFKFLKRNLEQSISYYRMDKDQNFEKVMGERTDTFPTTVADPDKNNQSGFGQKSSQYIWQSRVFDGKLYFGTFDETMVLTPLAKEASKNLQQQQKTVEPELQSVSDMIDAKLAEETIEETTDEVITEEAVAEEADTFAVDLSSDEFVRLSEIRNDFEDMKANGQVYAVEDIDTQCGTVLAPKGTTSGELLVKIESTEDLYLALLVLDEVMKKPAKGGVAGELRKFSDCVNLQNEISTYAADPANEVPEYMQASVKAAEGTPDQQGKYEEIKYIVDNLEGCVAGFDMYSTSDGENFEQITRSGLGDPFNHGLRAFATNESENNKWMCVGSANGYWGTSIYRMNTGVTPDIVDPKQIRVQLKFVEKDGTEVKIDPDKSPEIYVNEGEKSVLPKTVAGITPVNYKPADPEKAVEIVDGVATINIVPNALVSINYKEGDKIIKTETAPHTKGNKTVSRKYVEERLPEGYMIISDAKKFDVTPAPTEGQNDFVDIEVKKALTVTVKGGKADKTTVAAGNTVKITADKAPEGQVFDKWVETTAAEEGVTKTPVEFADATKEETTFVMPGNDVTIEATFKEKGPEKEKFAVTVKGGKSDVAEAAEGDTVKVTAEVPEGKTFVSWTGEGVEFADAKAAETTFTMPAKAVTVEATFKDADPEAQKFAVTVKGGKSDVAEAAEGDTVKVTAEVPEGKVFVSWTGEGVEFADAAKAETTFTMPAKAVTVEATFKDAEPEVKTYAVTVKNGTADVEEAAEGATVTVTAKVPEGKTFVSWTGEGVEFADAKAVETTFVMPAKAVTVTAKLDVKNGWEEADGNKYYYVDGEKVIDWKFIEGEWYYFSRSGIMQTGWLHISGPTSDTFYLREDGTMARGWCEIEGEWYYFNASGVMQTGWVKVNNTWFYMNTSGVMLTDWQYLGGNWFYMDKAGHMLTGWQFINGNWFYMNTSGHMQTGWVYAGGNWFYMNGSGHMKTGWVYADGSWFYMNKSGHMLKGWQFVEGSWYYFKSSGAMVTGWYKVSNTWYYFKSSGAMVTGWAKVGNSWYYFKSSGAMVTGWYKVGNAWYYFYKDGHMASNTTIDGCRLNSSGAWV